MKLVYPNELDNYLFLGGKISLQTILGDLHPHAYAAAGDEIVKIFLNNEHDAHEAKKRLLDISADQIADINVDNNILEVWPHYLKKSPLQTPDRKYKIAYKLLNALALRGQLYYNENTGEIYVDKFTNDDIVRKLVKNYNQKVYVVSDKAREYVSLIAVDYVTIPEGQTQHKKRKN